MTLSPPQRLLLDMCGGLVACAESYFAGLQMWAPRIRITTSQAERCQSGRHQPGITLIAEDDATAAAWSTPVQSEPRIVRVLDRGRDRTIAIVDIEGFLAKDDLVDAREQLRDLREDESIHGIVLRIDSPGGTVAGTADLAQEIGQVRQAKPVWAYAEDLMASAAYWIGSQAERIYANVPTCLIGDVGTLIGLYDRKKQFDNEGVKAIVIRTGQLKGAGFPGTEITAEQQAYWQGLVNATQAEFNKAVKNGRKIDPATVATGRLYTAADAVTLKLIDDVKSLDDVLAELASKTK